MKAIIPFSYSIWLMSFDLILKIVLAYKVFKVGYVIFQNLCGLKFKFFSKFHKYTEYYFSILHYITEKLRIFTILLFWLLKPM